jgi:hypothetical protein
VQLASLPGQFNLWVFMMEQIRFLVLALGIVLGIVPVAYAQQRPGGLQVLDDLAGRLLMQRAPELQSVLGVNDQDWPILLTKIKNVMNVRESLGVIQRDFSRRPAPPPTLGTPAVNWRNLPFTLPPIQVAQHELMDALADPNAPADVIKSKLETYRSIRLKVLADIRDAEVDLKSICTSRQEAILVTYGILTD